MKEKKQDSASVKVSAINKKLLNFWNLLLIVSTIAIVAGIMAVYVPTEDAKRGPRWKEELLFPFYFTIQSNVFAFVVSFAYSFNFIKDTNVRRRLEIFMFVNLLLTFLVYWGVLFPISRPIGWENWIANFLLHLFVPAISIAIFYIDAKHNKKIFFDPKKDTFINSIYLIIWFIPVLIIYFALGGKKEDAIYSFLNFNGNLPIAIIMVLFLPIIYMGITYFTILLSNTRSENWKVFLKKKFKKQIDVFKKPIWKRIDKKDTNKK